MKLVDLQEARYVSKSWKLDDFQVGDKLIFTYRSADGIEHRAAEVAHVNYNDLGGITYRPDYTTELLGSGQGHFDPKEIGTKRYGIIDVEIRKRRLPTRRRRVYEAKYAASWREPERTKRWFDKNNPKSWNCYAGEEDQYLAWVNQYEEPLNEIYDELNEFASGLKYSQWEDNDPNEYLENFDVYNKMRAEEGQNLSFLFGTVDEMWHTV
jgi:hypothetical protein